MKARVEHKKISGIYCIRNLITGKIYVGKSINIYRRINEHITKLNHGQSDNIYLQRSWIKDNQINFDYCLLELCNEEIEMASKELYWMKELKALIKQYGYNLRSDSDSKMIVHANTRMKISNRLKNEWKKGVRKDHGKKLSSNWNKTPKRRLIQSNIMSKVLTKYLYKIGEELFSYKQISEKGYKNVLSQYHRKKCNKVLCKGIWIERILINNQ